MSSKMSKHTQNCPQKCKYVQNVSQKEKLKVNLKAKQKSQKPNSKPSRKPGGTGTERCPRPGALEQRKKAEALAQRGTAKANQKVSIKRHKSIK